jgi:ribosomal protein S18 acetylase RimI-like enzyme
MQIRAATAADADAVVALWRDTPDVLATRTDDVGAVKTLLARDANALLVAEVDDTIVATLIVGWDGWRGSLYRMAVDPAARRRGIATALVRHAEAMLASYGCVRVVAMVNVQEDHAMSFWRAAGFTRNDDDGRFVRNLG